MGQKGGDETETTTRRDQRQQKTSLFEPLHHRFFFRLLLFHSSDEEEGEEGEEGWREAIPAWAQRDLRSSSVISSIGGMKEKEGEGDGRPSHLRTLLVLPDRLIEKMEGRERAGRMEKEEESHQIEGRLSSLQGQIFSAASPSSEERKEEERDGLSSLFLPRSQWPSIDVRSGKRAESKGVGSRISSLTEQQCVFSGRREGGKEGRREGVASS